jgi:hypothetical protein
MDTLALNANDVKGEFLKRSKVSTENVKLHRQIHIGCSSTFTNEFAEPDCAFDDIKKLAGRETAIINRWKLLLLSLWLVGATFVAAGSHILLAREEHANCMNAVSRV